MSDGGRAASRASTDGQSSDAQSRTASVFDVVMGDGARPAHSGRWAVRGGSWLLALCAHLLVLVLANRAEPSLETWSARMAALIHEELASQAAVTIEQPPPEPEPEKTVPAPTIEPSAPAPEVSRRSRARPRATPQTPAPPPPADAAAVLAADPSASADFTGTTFVTGTASTYVGGATVTGGQGKAPAPAPPAGTADRAPATARNGPSQARPVQLSGRQWRCQWPSRALDLDIYEQFVVLRAAVRADGRVERVTLVDDPGQGFGAAAKACAMKTRFEPARDAAGQPVRALSPPIRVRFTR